MSIFKNLKYFVIGMGIILVEKANGFAAYFKEEKRKAKIRKGLKAERISRYSGHYPLYVTKPCCVTYRDNDTEWTKYGDTVTNTLTGENRFYEW